ncbi:MAG: GIY-YIG nuclease family protein [Paludibacter sp.]
MYIVYIIHSATNDSYYIGQTCDLTQRLSEHNSGLYKGAYTKQANDWEIFCTIDCESRQQAIRIENHIKRMKKRTYYNSLKQYPEIIEKLLNQYKD